MWARKVVIKVMALSIVAFLVQPAAAAKKGRQTKTVGDLLKRIDKNTKSVKFSKEKSALPSFTQPVRQVKKVDLQAIKPPSRSRMYYEDGTNEAQLEKVTDQGIKQLFKLTQQFKNSKRRGELWLRLAELYVEKARLIEYRLQQKHDEKVQAFQKKELKTRPVLDLKPAQAYNRRAIQLYEWFVRDFPNDPKIDQALFFLGYNYFELNQPERGRDYYKRLTDRFPKSQYVEESNFALGEYHFEREQWADALKHYSAVAANKRARLYSFALYKTAWCQYKTAKVKEALKSLERVIYAGRLAKSSKDNSAGSVGRIRLATEAQRDLVIFYAEAGTPAGARGYFERVVGRRGVFPILERLAYYYGDMGNREGARLLFRDLIQERPNAPKAYDYQYQIVSMYTSTDRADVFRNELYNWIQNYTPNSEWAKANAKDPELVAKANQLIEATLRNHILQQHQTAQNSRVPTAQKAAQQGYNLYFQVFKEGPKVDEMHFFYAELLFDMKEYPSAAQHYAWVTENASNSPYFEKASLNMVLATEKGLPEEAALKKMVGDSLDPVAFNPKISAFENAAVRYMKAFPKGENVPAIKYKLGALYYYHNQFDKALDSFNSIIRDYPKSQYAQFSANLTLDIYNLKKDYVGLEKAGQEILSNEALAKSQVGDQVKGVLQRASFKKAQDLEAAKDHAKAAEAYEQFAIANPKSDLAISASFNSAVNYERAGDLFKAIGMYGLVMADRQPKNEKLKNSSSQFVAALYEKTGQFQKAAEAFESYAQKNPKSAEARAFYFNAAVIRDGMNAYTQASNNYQKYFDMTRSADKWEAVFLMAKLNERRGNLTQAQNYYKQYYQAWPKNPASVVESAYMVAQIYARRGRKADANTWYQKVISAQKALSQKEPVGVGYAAEAKYILVSKTYDDLRSIRIPNNPAKQAKAVQEKLAYIQKLQKQLRDVIKYDDAHMIVNSLTLIGQANQHMAAAIYGVPHPKGLNEEELKQYKAGVDKVAKPFQDEAIKNYEAAIQRGLELEGYSEGLKTAHRELSRLNSEKYPDFGERAIMTKITDYMGLLDQTDLAGPFKAKDERGMVDVISRRLGKNPNDLSALNTLAVFYFEQNKLGLARILWTRALKEHPNEPGLHNNLGVIYLAENKQRLAIASLRKSLEIRSNYTVGAANLGSIFVEYKDYARASKLLAEGYSAVRSDLRRGVGLDVANNYALALAGSGDGDKAKDIFKTILKADGSNLVALMNYAILLVYRLKDKSEGEKQLNRLRFVADDSDSRARKLIDDLDKKLSEN